MRRLSDCSLLTPHVEYGERRPSTAASSSVTLVVPRLARRRRWSELGCPGPSWANNVMHCRMVGGAIGEVQCGSHGVCNPGGLKSL